MINLPLARYASLSFRNIWFFIILTMLAFLMGIMPCCMVCLIRNIGSAIFWCNDVIGSGGRCNLCRWFTLKILSSRRIIPLWCSGSLYGYVHLIVIKVWPICIIYILFLDAALVWFQHSLPSLWSLQRYNSIVTILFILWVINRVERMTELFDMAIILFWEL